MEEINAELQNHQRKLDQLSDQQDQIVQNAGKLQDDVTVMEKKIGEVDELRSNLEQTDGEVQEQHQKLDQLSTQQLNTDESVQQIRHEVNNMQTEVLCFCSCYSIRRGSTEKYFWGRGNAPFHIETSGEGGRIER